MYFKLSDESIVSLEQLMASRGNQILTLELLDDEHQGAKYFLCQEGRGFIAHDFQGFVNLGFDIEDAHRLGGGFETHQRAYNTRRVLISCDPASADE